MIAESWGRVRRGVVWHLITGPDSTLCEGGLYGPASTSAAVAPVPYIEVSMGLPPAGGRPCPRCVAVVDDLTLCVINAVAGQQLRMPRLVEEVDLLASLSEHDDDHAEPPSLPTTIAGPLGYAADMPASDLLGQAI